MKKATIAQIKKEAKQNGVEIKKSRSLLNGKEAWEIENGCLMTKSMLISAYYAGEFY